jgi:hypothetical protein
VRLPDLLQRIPGQEIPGHEAEARRAWDELTKFVKKYVSNDVYGNYGPQYGWYAKSYPKLNDRMLDTVRRTGGWDVYARMTDEDFPFVQKRFFEEYAAWTAVEEIDASKLLAELPQLQLVANRMNPASAADPERTVTVAATFTPKRIPEPMTDAQLQDRREMLRQQAAACRSRQEQRASAAAVRRD